jgi:hypothetical protein
MDSFRFANIRQESVDSRKQQVSKCLWTLE